MRAALAALALLLSGAPALAQQSRAVCDASWALVTQAAPVSVSAEISVDGALCVATAVEGRGGGSLFEVDRLTWEGQGLAKLAEEGIPPRSLSVQIDRARAIALTGDRLTDFIRRAAARHRAVSGRLVLRWDGLTNRLFLDELAIDFPGDNAVQLVGQAGGVNLSTMGALRSSLGRAALTSLTLDMTSHGLFERHLLEPLLLLTLEPGQDPARALPGIVARLTRAIEALPDSSVAEASRSAMIAYVEALPSPSGSVRVTVTADPPLGWVRLAPIRLGTGAVGPDRLDALLDGVRIRFEYARRPAPQ